MRAGQLRGILAATDTAVWPPGPEIDHLAMYAMSAVMTSTASMSTCGHPYRCTSLRSTTARITAATLNVSAR